MSHLPGNPYATVLADYTDPRNSLEACATLALAYEQRTANLIALAQMEHRGSNGAGFSTDYDAEKIYPRLGLGE